MEHCCEGGHGCLLEVPCLPQHWSVQGAKLPQDDTKAVHIRLLTALLPHQLLCITRYAFQDHKGMLIEGKATIQVTNAKAPSRSKADATMTA